MNSHWLVHESRFISARHQDSPYFMDPVHIRLSYWYKFELKLYWLWVSMSFLESCGILKYLQLLITWRVTNLLLDQAAWWFPFSGRNFHSSHSLFLSGWSSRIFSFQVFFCEWMYFVLHYNDVIIVSNHQPHDCLLNRWFRHRSKKISKLRVTGLCEGNSPVTGEFPAQRASNVENVSIWWRHHAPRGVLKIKSMKITILYFCMNWSMCCWLM